ncbi:MAG: type I-C CRISPR-associated protein Cas8c/Csd1 [Erysipelotrichaceae bacterium]
MTWASKLYETYENCSSFAGINDHGIILMPIAHTTVSANIECCLDSNGNMYHAVVLPKDEAKTMIPCSIESSNRTGKGACKVPHPLFDKLFFMAKDFKNYYNDNKYENSYEIYENHLVKWCNSEFGNEKVKFLLSYLKKGTLIKDLVSLGVLYCDEKNQLLDDWDSDDEKPAIFKVANQKEAVIRFRLGNDIEGLWEDIEIQNSFINYYVPTIEKQDLCFITGKTMPITTKNPAKIRNVADMAKLISSNDSTGFTYRGLLTDSEQCMAIGYMTSQKIHNALKWLIERQGYRNLSTELAIIVWGTHHVDTVDPLIDTGTLFSEIGEELGIPSTNEEYAKALNKAINGYGSKRFTQFENVVVMGIDSATPGRLSIVYYNELEGSNYLKQLKKWHLSCAWQNQIRYEAQGKDEKGKIKYKRIVYTGAPSPKSIINVAYGKVIKETLMKSTTKRLLSCIIDGNSLPRDIIENVFNRLVSYSTETEREFDESLHVGCALIRKYLNDMERGTKEEWKMNLDLEQKDTSYLWGRLLAYAHELESTANYLSDKENAAGRETNAERYRKQFQLYPVETWFKIYDNLKPYRNKFRRAKSGGILFNLDTGMNEISAILEINDPSLISGALKKSFILGYCAQLDEFRKIKLEKKQNKVEREED